MMLKLGDWSEQLTSAMQNWHATADSDGCRVYTFCHDTWLLFCMHYLQPELAVSYLIIWNGCVIHCWDLMANLTVFDISVNQHFRKLANTTTKIVSFYYKNTTGYIKKRFLSDRNDEKRQEKQDIFDLFRRCLLTDFGNTKLANTNSKFLLSIERCRGLKKGWTCLVFLPFLLLSSLKHRFLISCGVFALWYFVVL